MILPAKTFLDSLKNQETLSLTTGLCFWPKLWKDKMLAVIYKSLEAVVVVEVAQPNKMEVTKKLLKKKKNLRLKKNPKIWIWVVSLIDLLIEFCQTIS